MTPDDKAIIYSIAATLMVAPVMPSWWRWAFCALWAGFSLVLRVPGWPT